MPAASVSGKVTGDAPGSYWPMFSLSLITGPEIFFRKVIRASYSVSFLEWRIATTDVDNAVERFY